MNHSSLKPYFHKQKKLSTVGLKRHFKLVGTFYRSRWMLLFMVATFALSAIGAFVLLSNNWFKMVNNEGFLIHNGSYVKYELARFHIGFDKLAQTDSTINREDVWQHLQQASRHVQSILQNGDIARFGLPPMVDTKLRDATKRTLDHIAELKKVAHERLKGDPTYVSGSATDQTFDEIFMNALGAASVLESGIQQSASNQLSHYRLLSNGFGAVLFILAITFAIRVFFYERNRDETLRMLREREQSLKQSEKNLCSLVETTSDWVWEVGPNGTYSYASPKIVDLLGYQPDEMTGMTPYDVTPENVAGRAAELLVDRVNARQPFSRVEIIRLHKNGSELVCETSGVPIFGANGTYLGYRGIDRNITERKHAETALQESRSMLQLVLNSIPVRVFWKDCESVYLGCNQCFAEYAGLRSSEEIIGKNDFELNWLEQAELYRSDDQRVIRTGVPKLHYEEPQAWPDGTSLWLRTSKVPLSDTNGKIIGVLGCYEDITQSKNAEAALRTSESRLAEAQRIAQLGNWDWNMESDDLYWSDEIYRIFGLIPQKFKATYKAFLEAVHPDDRDLVERSLHDTLCKKQPYSIDYRILLPGGEMRTVHEEGEVTFDDSGKAIRMFGTTQDMTDRKRAEEDLDKTQALLLAAIEQTPAGIIVADAPDGRIHIANSAAIGIRGDTKEPLTHIPMRLLPDHWQTYHPDGTSYKPEDLPLSKAILNGEESSNVEMVIHRATGEKRWVLVNSAPVKNSTGAVIAGVSVFPDITELKKAEEELRRYRDHLEDLVTERTAVVKQQARIIDQIHDAVVSIDPDGRVTSWNRGAERMFGYRTHEAMGQAISFLYPDEVAYNLRDQVAVLLKNSNNYEFEERMRRKDGEVFYAHASLSLRDDGTGSLTGMIGYYLDITKRKRAEEALRASERRCRAVVEDQTELICRYKSDGTLSFVNDAYCRYFSKTGDELIGQSFMAFIPQEDWALATNNIQSLSAEKPVADIEHRVVLPDGAIRWHHWTNRAIFDHEHTLTEYQAVGYDITERKEAEAQLRTQSAELAAINRELESFSYSVSHDLRAPLRSIDGFSQALLEDYADQLDETGKDYLRRVRMASQRMAELIDDLLMLSRVNRQEMRYERVDLSTMAVEIASELQGSYPERSVEFSIQKGLRVLCDKQLLRIVVENLLGNAFKYTAREDCARIEVGTTQHKGRRIFFVRDNGVGFDREYAGKLFQPFQRLHGNEEFEGTGIGLATVARIIHRHDGSVWAEADVDQGATFYFSLPENEE